MSEIIRKYILCFLLKHQQCNEMQISQRISDILIAGPTKIIDKGIPHINDFKFLSIVAIPLTFNDHFGMLFQADSIREILQHIL